MRASCRYERGAKEDGRRCHKWFLVDDAGTEHLAVIGLETDTLDGHYTYQAVRVASSRPLLHSATCTCFAACLCLLQQLSNSCMAKTALSTAQVVCQGAC
jgi:hypothetical protein